MTFNGLVLTMANAGMYSCVGKQLAMIELRWVITMMVANYDMKLAPGFDMRNFYNGCQDAFTLTCGPLEIQLDKRQS